MVVASPHRRLCSSGVLGKYARRLVSVLEEASAFADANASFADGMQKLLNWVNSQSPKIDVENCIPKSDSVGVPRVCCSLIQEITASVTKHKPNIASTASPKCSVLKWCLT